MSDQGRPELPSSVFQFLRDLEGALGDHFVGAILFGSWADGNPVADSDMDLAVIVSDLDREKSRQEVFRVLAHCGLDRNTLSLSVESYLRIKEFLGLGDPFAWVVLTEGKILKDRRAILSDLQQHCSSDHAQMEVAPVARYLQDKCGSHYAQAMQAFNQFLSNVQISVMAGAQATAAQRSQGRVTGADLADLADWGNLKSIMQETSATNREIEILEQLVLAHKNARSEEEFPGKTIIDMMLAAADLWKRLLPQTPGSPQGRSLQK